jgi:hypothetical protein
VVFKDQSFPQPAILPVPFHGIPYIRRHEAILAKAKPEWALNPTLKRLTGAATFVNSVKDEISALSRNVRGRNAINRRILNFTECRKSGVIQHKPDSVVGWQKWRQKVCGKCVAYLNDTESLAGRISDTHAAKAGMIDKQIAYLRELCYPLLTRLPYAHPGERQEGL